MAMRLGAGRLPSQNAWRSALAGLGFAATHIPAIAHLGNLRVGCNGEKKEDGLKIKALTRRERNGIRV